MPTSLDSQRENPRKQRVIQAIEGLGIGFKVEDHPELWDRLARTGEHFEDAVCMARMLEAVWGKLDLKGISREKMMLCALLHDIGKSGPDKDSPSLQRAVMRLFKPPPMPFNPYRKVDGAFVPKTIREFMREAGTENPMAVAVVLAEELGVDVATKPIIEFWRDHAEWTYQILSRNKKGMVDDEVVVVASSHHILDGRNPARVPLDDVHPGSKVLELMDKYQVLAMIDKYQAFRGRSGFKHAAAIKILRDMVQDRKDLPDRTREDYLRIIAVLEASEQELAAAMAAASGQASPGPEQADAQEVAPGKS